MKYLKANGFTDSEIQVLPETKYPHQVNVVVRIKGNGKSKLKPVMWMGHMDVVDAKADDWTLAALQVHRTQWLVLRPRHLRHEG